MKIVIYISIILSVISCSSNSFYAKMKSEKDIYHDFLKHKQNKQTIKHFDKHLKNTQKLIIVGTLEYPFNYDLIYDCTNNKTYYKRRNVQNSNSEYFTEPLNKSEQYWFSTLSFSLNYVLTNNVNELKSISNEAIRLEGDGHSIYIEIIDVSNNTYTEFDPIPYFYVYEGKPIMTDEEYWSIDWGEVY